jgi:hypothetical protein
VELIIILNSSWLYLYKSPSKKKIPKTIKNKIRVSSVRRKKKKKREAVRQLTSHNNSAQNTDFRIQYYKYDLSQYATAQKFYRWSLRHYF